MKCALIQNGQIVKTAEFDKDPPKLSSAKGMVWLELVETVKPEYNPLTQRLRESGLWMSDKQCTQQWKVEDLPQRDADKNLAAYVANLQASIVQATQERLDDFAKTRNYDGILSACTYATSGVPRFASEGQYAVNARDETWATLYQIMGDVEAGKRAMPGDFGDVEGDLPDLTWPG